jgi:xanthine/CO dehydrogenase XdhC/CoxF family maturation factor
MKEYKDIIRSFDISLSQNKAVALCTVVHVDGSSYRRPGARMLIDEHGYLTGAISGGCLEGDALRKALLVINKKISKLVTYDTSDEDDATIGIQLGCQGIVQVLFEPILVAQEFHPVELIRQAIASRKECVIVNLFDVINKNEAQLGTCMLVDKDGRIKGNISDESLKNQILIDVESVFEARSSKFIRYQLNDNEQITAFIEYIMPPISLIVIGAGNDAIPLVNFADQLGWQVRVADGRNNLANQERFPAACQVLASKPEAVLDQFILDVHTAVVLMTHNYNYDLAMLKILLNKEVFYIGSLGPKKKLNRMIEEISSSGYLFNDQILDKIHGPIGLEIGAETAEEIALSTLAEIQAVYHNKRGGKLRDKEDVIHNRSNALISYHKIMGSVEK